MTLNHHNKKSLLQLWQTDNIKNYELAFKILEGFYLEEKDYEWLIEMYQNFQKNIPQQSFTLRHFPQISTREILNGYFLQKIFQSNISTIEQYIFEIFHHNNTFKLPYIPIQKIPLFIYEKGKDIQQLIFQDGILDEIGAEILLMENLRRLDLRRQPITHIHPNIIKNKNLKEIYLVSASFIPEEIHERQDIEIYTDAPY